MRVIEFVYLAGCLFAGTTLSEFKGRLTEGATASYDGLVVEVTNLQDRTIREHVDVSSDGSFGFRPIPDGSYQVRVLTRYGDEITSALTSIGPSALPFEIRLPQAGLSKPVAGTVSIQQLNHPPSRQAQKLLESGHKLEREHNYDAAAARFREAARDAPNSVQAHADLGLALSNLRQWDAAADEYRAAIALA
jgi:tetratricopeptide (TPR) repeat protein